MCKIQSSDGTELGNNLILPNSFFLVILVKVVLKVFFKTKANDLRTIMIYIKYTQKGRCKVLFESGW